MERRFVQRRRPQLDTTPSETAVREGRSVHRCGLLREAVEATESGIFTGRLIRAKRPWGIRRGCFSGSRCRRRGIKAPEFVVRMQHTRRTFIETARTPKKAAHACLFCFTIVTPQTTV